MSDPLSVAAGVAGLLSLGIQVTEALVKFYISYHGQDADVARMTERLKSLLETFRYLDAELQSRRFQPDEQGVIQNIEASIQRCDGTIRELQDECQKFKTSSKRTGGFKGAIKRFTATRRRATYPFREGTLQKLNENISEVHNSISLALEILQLKDHRTTQAHIQEVKSLGELIQLTQISSKISDWLKAPDASVNHNNACAKHHVGTGTWFLADTVFTRWLAEKSSFLWLNGFAGCGKSVLFSAATQRIFREKQHEPGVGIAFFYFTFNDESKQDESAMLRTLLFQLSAQVKGGPKDLVHLHVSYKSSTPPATVLIQYLRRLVQKFQQVYILLDALDESPRRTQQSPIRNARNNVLATIREIRHWHLPELHVLVTSRDEPDIRKSLKPTPDQEVAMDNSEIEQDIRRFISYRLKISFQDWSKHHDQIQQALAERAHGGFRWVECQFEALENCPQSEYHLVQCLQSLPEGLDETYERMLCSIDKRLVEDARRVLNILCYSARPPTIPELIDGIAIDLGEPAHYDHRRRLNGAEDILKICPGLLNISHQEDEHGTETVQTVHIAHFSVQEYLESSRIAEQKAAHFALNRNAGHAEIAHICLTYLLESGVSSGCLDEAWLTEFPLARFAATFWNDHYAIAMKTTSRLDALVLKLFQQTNGAFRTWVKLRNTNSRFKAARLVAPPLYYASLLAFDQVLNVLITEIDIDMKRKNLINAGGGIYGNALQAASHMGHEKIVQTLLDYNADVNVKGGHYGNALQAASYNGHEKIVQMILDNKADANAQGGVFNTALQAAAFTGQEEIFQLLLKNKADINIPGGYYGNALQAAAYNGHERIVQILLDNDADVNEQGGHFGNALSAASFGGFEELVQIFIKNNASLDIQGGFFGTPLQAASANGHEGTVRVLLDNGASVNTQAGYYGNALQAASRGHEKIVQLLLDNGADVNAQGGTYGSALQKAAGGGHLKTMQVLLDNNADVNIQGGAYGDALQAALSNGHAEIVQSLLDRGAETDGRGGSYGKVLDAEDRQKVIQRFGIFAADRLNG